MQKKHVEDCDEDENQQNHRCDDEAQDLESSGAPPAAAHATEKCFVEAIQMGYGLMKKNDIKFAQMKEMLPLPLYTA